MTDAIRVGKPACIDQDQYIAKVIRKEKDAKWPGYRREPWSSAKNDDGKWEYEKLKGVYVKGGRKGGSAVYLNQVRIADQLT